MDYIRSVDKKVLKERSEIMDQIEFSGAYPTKDRMKIAVSCLEVGINLIAESLGISVTGEDYRNDINCLLKDLIGCIESHSIEGVER